MFLALAALSLQTLHPVPVPSLSIGCDPELSQTFQRIIDLEQKGDFEGAKAAVHLLPRPEVKIEWDDSAIPAASRFDFAAQRNMVFREWQRSSAAFQSSLVSSGGDIRVEFAPEGGVTEIRSVEPGKPRITLRIGTKGKGAPINLGLVHNSFSHAVASYLGVTKIPQEGYIMSGLDPSSGPVGISQLEVGIANGNVLACQRLRQCVDKSFPVSGGTPSLSPEPGPIDLGTVDQGRLVTIKIPLTNAGKAALAYKVVPDCSCFAVIPKVQSVEPGRSAEAMVSMSTREFTGIVQGGVIHHNLYLYTNDPTNPIRTLPLQIKVKPRYRMLPNRSILVAGDKGISTTVYLFYPPNRPLKITNADSEGLPGTVTYVPWKGTMADPDLGEGPLPRQGYKITLNLGKVPAGGVFGTSIALGTDDPDFDHLMYEVMLQKGIVVQPSQLFMAEVGAAPRQMAFMLSQPGKPFRITKLSTDSEHLSAAYAPTKNVGEYRVTVTYDGKAEKGDYRGTVMVMTDDPTQKSIEVSVSGTVR